jgi:hypothetical protein
MGSFTEITGIFPEQKIYSLLPAEFGEGWVYLEYQMFAQGLQGTCLSEKKFHFCRT